MYALLDQKQSEVANLCLRLGARRLDIFGSAVRADFDPEHSDLDFLVEFDYAAPAAYAQAFFALKEGLKALFNRPVDLLQLPPHSLSVVSFLLVQDACNRRGVAQRVVAIEDQITTCAEVDDQFANVFAPCHERAALRHLFQNIQRGNDAVDGAVRGGNIVLGKKLVKPYQVQIGLCREP